MGLGLIGATLAGALAVAAVAIPLALAGAPSSPAGTPLADPAVAVGGTVADIPPVMLRLYMAAASRCRGLPWPVLAAIGKVESDHGRGSEISSAGAEGPMQFLPSTWATYGVDGDGDGVASIWDAADAVPAAADYLCANGGGDPAHIDAAILQYNHDDDYLHLVLAWAGRYANAAASAPA
jgi:hypothetical protein